MPESKVHIESAVDPLFGENAYVVFERPGGRCWIVDPSFDPQPRRIAEIVSEHSLEPAAILITHCHGDHIVGIDTIKKAWPQVELYVPAAEVEWLDNPAKNLSAGFGMQLRVTAKPTRAIKPGDSLQLETLTWQVLDVSGHSPGGTAYYCPRARVVITGDALFAGSIGRTDLPDSDHQLLLDNIRNHLLSLPENVAVYAGHGPVTTIGQERAENPFLG